MGESCTTSCGCSAVSPAPVVARYLSMENSTLVVFHLLTWCFSSIPAVFHLHRCFTPIPGWVINRSVFAAATWVSASVVAVILGHVLGRW